MKIPFIEYVEAKKRERELYKNPECHKCKWWIRIGENYVGECRINPPQIYSANVGDRSSNFPTSCEEDFCSKFEPKEQPKER